MIVPGMGIVERGKRHGSDHFCCTMNTNNQFMEIDCSSCKYRLYRKSGGSCDYLLFTPQDGTTFPARVFCGSIESSFDLAQEHEIYITNPRNEKKFSVRVLSTQTGLDYFFFVK